MRLISQNGLFDYPYSSDCFIKCTNKDGIINVNIYRSMLSKNGIIFASYSSEKHAATAIEGILRAKSRGRQFYRFPTEEEIQWAEKHIKIQMEPTDRLISSNLDCMKVRE